MVYAVPTYFRENPASWITSQFLSLSNNEPSGTLDTYKLVRQHAISSIAENLSGITFDPDRNQFWAVTNSPTELFSLNLAGDVLNRYVLNGFEDTEDIAYLDGGKLVLVEERRMSISIFDAPTSDGPINKQDAQNLGLLLGNRNSAENEGLEGVSYDPLTDRLLLAQEKNPRKLFTLHGLNKFLKKGELNIRIAENHPWIESQYPSGDVSAISFDFNTGNLTFLNEESGHLSEFDETGKVFGNLALKAGHAGLEIDIPQAEGVTYDNKGNLYIVSEPNLFYVFSKF